MHIKADNICKCHVIQLKSELCYNGATFSAVYALMH